MKKILALVLGTLCLFGCTKEYITNEYITIDTPDTYCIIDKLFEKSNGPIPNFDTTLFIKQDSLNVLHLVKTLSLYRKPKTYDYETGITLYDTTYHWTTWTQDEIDYQGYSLSLNNPSDVFNFYIGQKSADSIKTSSGFRKIKIRRYSDDFSVYANKGYVPRYSDWELVWDKNNYTTITVKDTIIDIVCPHDIEREYYYHKYSK